MTRPTLRALGARDPSIPAPALRVWAILLTLFVASLTGCDGDATGPIDPAPRPDPVAQVVLNPFEATLRVGQTLELDVQLTAADGTVLPDRTITFAAFSEIPNVVSVDGAGVVRALTAGIAVVRATSEGKTGDAAIVVIPEEQEIPAAPVIASFEPSSLPAGSPATEITVRGTGFDETIHAFWNGSGRTSTLVSETELKVMLRAEDLRLSGSGQLRVVTHGATGPRESNAKAFPIDRAVGLIEFRQAERILFPGESRPFHVRVLDDRGVEMEEVDLAWSSVDEAILEVGEDGWVKAVATGQAWVTVKAGARETSRLVRVSPTPSAGLMTTTWSPFGGDRAAVSFDLGPDGNGSTRPLGHVEAGQAVASPDGTRILFVSKTVDGGADLFVMNWTGGGVTRLTTNGEADDQPAWSPDGQSIAWRSFRNGYPDIWTMKADGSGKRQVTDFGPVRFGMVGAQRPAWSPDGQWIAFAWGDAGYAPARMRLARIRPDGSDMRSITEFSAAEDNEPSFSPDGTKIVFRRTLNGQDRLMISDLHGNEQVFAYDLGSGRRPR